MKFLLKALLLLLFVFIFYFLIFFLYFIPINDSLQAKQNSKWEQPQTETHSLAITHPHPC